MKRRIEHTLDQLQALEAIERTGSFAAAAEELHRVPSAISYAIKGLEDTLGVPLFDRSGRRSELTADGRLILRRAREVLAAARAVEDAALQIQGGWEAELHIVIDGVYPMSAITRVLRVFAEDNVSTRIRLDLEYQYGVPDRFHADDADIMLTLDAEEVPDTLDSRPLRPLDMALVVSADHPLTELETLDRDTLHGFMELVVRDSSPRFARTPRQAFLRSPNVTYLSDFHSKRIAVLGGAGFGWLPMHLIADDLTAGRLASVALDTGNSWTYNPQLLTRKTRSTGRAADLFIRTLLEFEKIEP